MSSRRAILASTVAATVLSSCGAVPDPDLVAEVEQNELSQEQFDSYVRELTDDDEATAVDGTTGRQIVGTFVGIEVLRADLESMDVDPLDLESDLEGLNQLQNDFQLLVQQWSSLTSATTLDDAVIDFYEQGPEASGFACVSHILVDTEEDADVVVEQLEAGAGFAEMAFETSTDSGSAANGGQLGCYPVEEFEVQFIPEFVDAALSAEVGAPTVPIESEFGWHIIELTPAEGVPPEVVVQLRLETFDDRYDIVINPRFGQWDPIQIIAPTT